MKLINNIQCKNRVINMARSKTDALIDRGQGKVDEVIEKGKQKVQERASDYIDIGRKKAMESAEKILVLAKYGINREILVDFKTSACFKELQSKYGDKLKAKLLKTSKLGGIQRIRSMSSEDIVKMFLSKLDTDALDSNKNKSNS